jgi:hypothetical protein
MEIDMNTFTLIIRKGPYNERTTPTDWISETPIQTTAQVIADIEEGQVDADDIRQIIEIDLVTGAARDVTQFVAIEVWREFDCHNTFAWKEMREWLESFNLDCEHLTGETKEIRHFYG